MSLGIVSAPVAENFIENFVDGAAIELRHLHCATKFAGIEPNPVVPRTFIEDNFFFDPKTGFLHFFSADRTPDFLFLALDGGIERGHEFILVCRGFEHELELSPVEPDTMARQTMIDLDLFDLEDNHRLMT